MRDVELYRHLLGLETPWTVRSVELNVPGQRGATRILRISWDEAWHILERAVERGQRAKHPHVTPHLGVDEKAIAKGHQYLTLVCDLDRSTVEYLAEDRKQASLES
jgi:transposase